MTFAFQQNPSPFVLSLGCVDVRKIHENKSFVIPAKAGIHHLHSNFTQAGFILLGPVMDSRLRGNDEVWVQGAGLLNLKSP
jgi:hypothetical protein